MKRISLILSASLLLGTIHLWGMEHLRSLPHLKHYGPVWSTQDADVLRNGTIYDILHATPEEFEQEIEMHISHDTSLPSGHKDAAQQLFTDIKEQISGPALIGQAAKRFRTVSDLFLDGIRPPGFKEWAQQSEKAETAEEPSGSASGGGSTTITRSKHYGPVKTAEDETVLFKQLAHAIIHFDDDNFSNAITLYGQRNTRITKDHQHATNTFWNLIKDHIKPDGVIHGKLLAIFRTIFENHAPSDLQYVTLIKKSKQISDSSIHDSNIAPTPAPKDLTKHFKELIIANASMEDAFKAGTIKHTDELFQEGIEEAFKADILAHKNELSQEIIDNIYASICCNRNTDTKTTIPRLAQLPLRPTSVQETVAILQRQRKDSTQIIAHMQTKTDSGYDNTFRCDLTLCKKDIQLSVDECLDIADLWYRTFADPNPQATHKWYDYGWYRKLHMFLKYYMDTPDPDATEHIDRLQLYTESYPNTIKSEFIEKITNTLLTAHGPSSEAQQQAQKELDTFGVTTVSLHHCNINTTDIVQKILNGLKNSKNAPAYWESRSEIQRFLSSQEFKAYLSCGQMPQQELDEWVDQAPSLVIEKSTLFLKTILPDIPSTYNKVVLGTTFFLSLCTLSATCYYGPSLVERICTAKKGKTKTERPLIHHKKHSKRNDSQHNSKSIHCH
jgi:hypothetical protein